MLSRRPYAHPENGAAAPTTPDRIAWAWRSAAIVVIGVVTYVGWRELRFLTDDAHITFRYISNRRLGFGYVWNAPPFRRVEGYSNFLWMVLLDLVWSLFGVAPPEASTVVSLLFGYATLWQTFRIATEIALPAELERARGVLAFLVVLGVATNHTFLVWLSSGLETALYSFLVVWWVRLGLRLGRAPEVRSMALGATAAALAALTRPDGLLLVAATPLLGWPAKRRLGSTRLLAGLAPLGLVLVHLVWRRSFYGEWLPNTYFAKQGAPWPEAGLRYVAAFVLEYALWSWLALVLLALVAQGRLRVRPRGSAFVCSGVLAVHVLYYGLVVGGDHFEYRIFHHLIPLVFVSALWASGRLVRRPLSAFATVLAVVGLSLPIPWIAHAQARTLEWSQWKPWLGLAPVLPRPLRPYGAALDQLQTWLVAHYVALRSHQHRMFWTRTSEALFPRSQGETLRFVDDPVLAAGSVGIVGWVLPHVAVIDTLGLNDWTVARTPVAPHIFRVMAHERRPTPGYVGCLEPNVFLFRGNAVHEPRAVPITPLSIAGCEAEVGLYADLRGVNLLHTTGVDLFGSGVAVGEAELQVELRRGWSTAETWPVGAGRWTGAEATAILERLSDERGLVLVLSCGHPSGATRGYVAVNGRRLASLPAPNGHHRMVLDVGAFSERRLEVRIVVENAVIPRELDPTSPDVRQLGVFVHELRLIDGPLPDSALPGRLHDDAPELVSGWSNVETWPEGLSGRWTGGEAVLELARGHDERALLVDASFNHPRGQTTGRLEIDGQVVLRFRSPNGPRTLVAALPAESGQRVRIHFVVDQPFVPSRDARGRTDERELGMFVHGLHLVRNEPLGSLDALPTEVATADVPDAADVLQDGWGAVREAADGPLGRWTDGDAGVLLATRDRARLTLALWPGDGRWARGRVEMNGELARPFIVGPAGMFLDVPVVSRGSRFVKLRIVTDRMASTSGPEDHPSPASGILVKSLRFANP